MKNLKTTSSYTLGIGTCLLVLFVITFIAYWHQTRLFPAQVMANDIAQLAKIFEIINERCGIIDFQKDHNDIDFLNVITFEGSEVGSMNLKFPEKWEGPYLKTNLTIQEKYYQVAKTKHGYFVLPGDGVIVMNEKIMGKDIIIDKNTDITDLIKNKALVDPSGRPLALPITTLNTPPSIILEDLFMYASHKVGSFVKA